MPTGVSSPTYTGRLLKTQVGQESAWGTAVPATARLMGLKAFPTFKPYGKQTLYDEARGALANAYNSSLLKQGGEFSMDYEYMSYEDIIYLLCNTLKSVNPTGGGPTYTWTFPGPLTAINNLLPYTMEFGYDIMTGQYAGCLGQKYTLKGEGEKQWEASWSGFLKTYTPNLAVNIVSSTNATPIVITTAGDPFATGQQVVVSGHLVNTAANGEWVITRTGAGTYSLTGSTGNGVGVATGTITRVETPSIADRTVTPAPFSGITQLWMEATGGNPGTTAYTGVFLGFEHTGENNVKPIWTGDALTPSSYAYDKLKPTLKLDLIENAQVKAFVEGTLMNGTGAVVRLKQSSGSNSAQVDFAGVLSADPDRYKAKDGAVMISVELEGRYDGVSSLANQLSIAIVNSSSTLV